MEATAAKIADFVNIIFIIRDVFLTKSNEDQAFSAVLKKTKVKTREPVREPFID